MALLSTAHDVTNDICFVLRPGGQNKMLLYVFPIICKEAVYLARALIRMCQVHDCWSNRNEQETKIPWIPGSYSEIILIYLCSYRTSWKILALLHLFPQFYFTLVINVSIVQCCSKVWDNCIFNRQNINSFHYVVYFQQTREGDIWE